LSENGSTIIQRTALFSDTSLQFHHEEYSFTLTEDARVGLYFKALHQGGHPSYVRFMIVDSDVVAEPFTADITGGGTISGVTCWEPYHVDLPLTVTSGAQSTTVTIDLGDSPLGAGDTIDYTTTEISIPTYEGSNTITAGTTVQPSSMYIKYEDDESSVGAFMNATDLAYVSIPESVELIGRNAFTNTSLTKVRISRDCVFYPTSFPANCDIWYYGDEPTPDGYYTAAQVDSLISALDARVTALEET
ncbi:MAG: leucine-rich repeat domain-containing protein, partial [Ruminococcus sp.]|nr:leucine-rich repeat domain-containing protein [Ruminococcus sp.]